MLLLTFSFDLPFNLRVIEKNVLDSKLGNFWLLISSFFYLIFFFLAPKIFCIESVSHSVVSNSATPRTVARQAPLSVDFSRQEYWSVLPFPPPGDLPSPGTEPKSLTFPALAGGFFTTSATRGLQSLESCPAPRPCAPSQSSCSPRAVRCTTLDSLCPYFCVFL